MAGKHQPKRSELAKTDGHKARKRFGQNFLQDLGVIQGIVDAIRYQHGEHMVEIGPGLGALTRPLLEECKQLTVIEIDRDLAAELPVRLNQPQGLTIVEADALKFDFATYAAQQYGDAARLRIVGNLPYNISTPIIFHLLQQGAVIQDMHFMLQKEVVDRIIAQPNTPEYGRLSVMVQYYCEVAAIFDVPPHAFVPAPKVNSAVFRLRPYQHKPFTAVNEQQLSALVLHVFNMRRKTLRSSLKGKISDDVFQRLNIDAMARPENLSVAQFVALSAYF